jgi:hypothetical protein
METDNAKKGSPAFFICMIPNKQKRNKTGDGIIRSEKNDQRWDLLLFLDEKEKPVP